MSGRTGPVGVVTRLLLGSAFPGRALCRRDTGEAAVAAGLDSPDGRSALTCIFIGQVIIIILIIIFLLEAARLQVLHVHVAHVACCSNNKNMFMCSDQPAFILRRLLPASRGHAPRVRFLSGFGSPEDSELLPGGKTTKYTRKTSENISATGSEVIG